MPEWLLEKSVVVLIIQIGIIVLAAILQRPLARLLLWLLLPRLRRRRRARYELVRKVMLQPLASLIFCGVALIVVHFISLAPKVADLVENILVSVLMIAAVWALYAAAGLISSALLDNYRDRQTAVNPTAAQFIAGAVQIAIVIIGVLTILARWVSNLSGLIAGLGIGGLAIALAAQDTASNFIGSIAIMLDKPFELGDFIEVDGISGTVERVGLRSSRVRAADNTLIYIPNAKMANYNIVNGTRRQHRRVAFRLAIPRSASPDTVRAFVDQARAILEADPDVENDGSLVVFDGFTVQTLEVSVAYYTSLDYRQMMLVKERVNLALLEAADHLGLACVLPPVLGEGKV